MNRSTLLFLAASFLLTMILTIATIPDYVHGRSLDNGNEYDGVVQFDQSLVAVCELVEHKPAEGEKSYEVRVHLENVSDKPVTVCAYPRNQPIKVEWTGPDGKPMKSHHYDWVETMRLAPLKEVDFVTIRPGERYTPGPRGDNTGIHFWPGQGTAFGNHAGPGKHTVKVSFSNKEDGKKFNQKKVWTGTIAAREVIFTIGTP